MKELVSKTITGILVGDDEGSLMFETTTGPVLFEVEGDCCSSSWFSDVLGVEALLGQTVLSVEDNPMDGYNVEDGRGRQDSDQVYGWTIATAKGRATVAFRNSSNGYYGGSCGYSNRTPDTSEWKRITDDWNA